MRVCAQFPGQGFQKFGMLASLAAKHPRIVEPILEQCETALPQVPLGRLLLGQGEPVDVTSTEIAQPLLLAHGVACFRAWETEASNARVEFGMGHSLGEYTAFVAANLLSFESALKLVRARGEAMKGAAEIAKDETGMTTIVKPRTIDLAHWETLLHDVTRESGVDVAAFNSPALTVVSGSLQEIDRTVQLLKSSDLVKSNKARVLAKRLPVSAAFHSKYMEPASSTLAKLVSEIEWNSFDSAQFSVISNVSGRPFTSISEIQRSCVVALSSPVKWLQSVRYLEIEEEIEEFIGIGGDIQKLMEGSTTNARSSAYP